MIKKSSQLALILLNNLQEEPVFYPFEQLNQVLGASGVTSLRSLWHLLEKNGLVVIDDSSKSNKRVSITKLGSEELTNMFPVFRNDWTSWNQQWVSIAFLEAPRGDKNFRYLRLFLVANGAVSFSRGMYIFPILMLPKIQFEIERAYKRSVLLFTIGELHSGQLEQLILEKYRIKEVRIAYSGVSKQIDQLLIKNRGKNILINREKNAISSIIESLYSVIQYDIGIINFYFPHSQAIKEILRQIQLLIFPQDKSGEQ